MSFQGHANETETITNDAKSQEAALIWIRCDNHYFLKHRNPLCKSLKEVCMCLWGTEWVTQKYSMLAPCILRWQQYRRFNQINSSIVIWFYCPFPDETQMSLELNLGFWLVHEPWRRTIADGRSCLWLVRQTLTFVSLLVQFLISPVDHDIISLLAGGSD